MVYKFPLIYENFINFSVFLFNLRFCLINVFGSPYFDYDAFMHHALHVLDASESGSRLTGYMRIYVLSWIRFQQISECTTKNESSR